MKTLSKPFLKWPGGKRWLVPTVWDIIRNVKYERYIEPFLGGGAMFFGLGPHRPILSDINGDLINVYRQVRANPQRLIGCLKDISIDSATYYEQRRSEPVDLMERAVRFLYLNRTAFSGMYRLNGFGKFNVPYGGGTRTTSPLTSTDVLTNASSRLQNADLFTSDFEPIIDLAGHGDLVYCDPTYTVAHNNNGFIRYNERNFSWRDQARLAEAAARASSRGAVVLVSNAVHDELRALYQSADTRLVTRWCGMCPRSESRQNITEHLFILRSDCESIDLVAKRESEKCL